MEERKRKVLQAIIDDYITGAEPVGSRTIARKYALGVSSATIRNEMADLEELGYLEQPHTSAGRIPSNKGYRYYVDHLMEKPALSGSEAQQIRKLLRTKALQMNSLIHQTVGILTEATDCLTVVATPEFSRSRLLHIQVMPLRDHKALLLMVSENGFTESKLIDLPRIMTLQELQHISNILTERLSGQSVSELGKGAIRELMIELNRYRDLLDQVLSELSSQSGETGEKLVLGSTTNILRQPEFKDIEQIQKLLSTLEQEKLIYNLLVQEIPEEGTRVFIGEEIEIRSMQECSLIRATYALGGKPVGYIGVLGPRRMPYARVIALVDAVTASLNELIEKNY